uniref:Odorant receptor n=1 Tax=Glossina austeni TaxID=7395 RepID=A0A1A9V0A3_GLOAU
MSSHSLKLEDNPMLEINVKVWKYLSVIFPDREHAWRVYVFVLPVCVMNIMQFVYLLRMWGDLAPFILNTFFAAAIFDALLRTCLVIINRDKFEAFLLELAEMYRDIEISESKDDTYGRDLLRAATATVRKISIFNLTASFFDIIGALIYPLLCEGRVHPFGVAIPGVNMTASPIYEIFYILQFPTPIILTTMYMPFVSLFASFAIFAKTALKVLQHRMDSIFLYNYRTEEHQFAALTACITYYSRIARLQDIDSSTQIISIVMYILTMLYVLFTYYWHANEVIMESVQVSETAYALPWYNCSKRFRKTLLLFIAQSQQPLQIMVGNVYPMTLATFQSLLNTSYTYFTMLRGLYG